jgi:hypothetical protein
MDRVALNLNPFDAMAEIHLTGFLIIPNVLPLDFIESQRNRWLDRFKKNNVDRKFVRGNLILGEKDFLSYSDIPGWCMYRNYEFLWNKSQNPEALNMHIALHKFRNLMQGFEENYGLQYNSSNYGLYISTSLYEVNKGFLSFHSDGHEALPLLHYMLPLTFKGVDYSEGGLYCNNREGKECDIDSIVNPGDIIFFDGRLRHGVKKIKSNSNSASGRLAAFSIPTFFQKDAILGQFKRSLNIRAKEIANKLGLIEQY